MSVFYEEEKRGKTGERLRRSSERIDQIRKSYADNAPLSSYSLADLGTIAYEAEMISQFARASAEEAEEGSTTFFEEDTIPECVKNNPCNVSFDGTTLTASLPLTIRRNDSKSPEVTKQNFVILTYLRAALTLWERQNHDKILFLHPNFTKGNLVLVIRRHAPEFKRMNHCDNDNLENGRILNLICQALGISDSARVMDLHSCFRIQDGPAGTDFILTSRDNLAKFL